MNFPRFTLAQLKTFDRGCWTWSRVLKARGKPRAYYTAQDVARIWLHRDPMIPTFDVLTWICRMLSEENARDLFTGLGIAAPRRWAGRDVCDSVWALRQERTFVHTIADAGD